MYCGELKTRNVPGYLEPVFLDNFSILQVEYYSIVTWWDSESAYKYCYKTIECTSVAKSSLTGVSTQLKLIREEFQKKDILC